MLAGIKAKYPPPDPDWRQHLPPPPPRPSRSWLIFMWGPMFIFYGLLLVGVIASLLGAGDATVRALALVAVLAMLLRVASRIAWAVHVQRVRRAGGWRPYRG